MKIRQARVLLPSSVRIILMLSILISLSSLAGYFFIFKVSSDANSKNEEATRPQRVKVLALGRLEPEGEIVSVAGQLGERIARIEVSDGNFVNAGEVLAYLESYGERLAQRDLAYSQLAEIQARIGTDTVVGRVEIDQARAQIEQVDTPQLLQTQSQQAVVRRLEAELTDAIRVRDRFQRLYSKGAIAQQDFDDKQLAVSLAQESLNQAKETLNQLVKARDANIQKAQTDLDRAQVNLERVNSHSGLRSAIQQLKLAEAQLERTIIRAPKSGQILKIFAYPGEAISQQGILELGNTRKMYAVAEVYETDVSLVKLGQRATVTSPAFSKPLTGTVTQIGRIVFKNNIIGDDPTANSDARVVEVKIRLAHSELVSSFSNLQVDVQIELSSTGEPNVSS